MPDLTDADLSGLITLVVIHEGESSSMRNESAKRLESHGLLNIAEIDHHPDIHFVTASGRALVARMMAAGRRVIHDQSPEIPKCRSCRHFVTDGVNGAWCGNEHGLRDAAKIGSSYCSRHED